LGVRVPSSGPKQAVVQCFSHLRRSKLRTDHFNKMVPLFMFSYLAAAVCFYRHIYKTAPIMEEEAAGCTVFELFPAGESPVEEIPKAA
jgi:hypothetical protein